MGICLDTDQQNGSQVFDDGDARSIGRWRGEAGLLATPPAGHFPMQNVGPVKFEPPKVPVIFILGGPGSGKVTHCDNLIQEESGITHINMTDLLQQYALGNDMQDYGLLSSKTVAEVLMLEMKMSPGSTTFLVSGYPRNMRDVVEYSEKIQKVSGVILISWRQEVLERQIDYGAQLGHVILGLARMELRNFYRNVMPVAEYFDRTGILLEVFGERNPSEVYVDFRDAITRILGNGENDFRAGLPQSLEAEVEVEREEIPSNPPSAQQVTPSSANVRVNGAKTANRPRKGLPSFIWVIGGPGSNKSQLCDQAVRSMPNWTHISIGGLLRAMAASNTAVHESIVVGEMVPQDIVMQLVEQQVLLNRDTDGIIIDGFPRDLSQVQEFESKFGQEPPLVLLDCSKLQLGRGKLDDSVPAFRKRLELFREISLPMLKTLDNDDRLVTVDGDTDVPSVQQDFAGAIYQLMRKARRKEESAVSTRGNNHPNSIAPDNINGGHAKTRVPNGISNHIVTNGLSHTAKSRISPANKVANGFIPVAKRNGVGTMVRGAVTEGVRIANGVVQNGAPRQNGGHAHTNGAANGAQHLLQNGVGHLANGVGHLANGVGHLANGVGHLANGFPPGTNRVAPATIHNQRDSIRKMYNEVDGYHENLHI